MDITTESARGQGWMEISFDIQPPAHEALSAFLFDLGCEGVVSEDFDEKALKGYLPLGMDVEETKTRIHLFLLRLKEIFPEIPIPEPVFRRLEEENWDLKWRRFFRPERISPNLLVLPAWESLPEGAEGHVLRMDPGPAFGTGQHPTTRMCLKAMEDISIQPPWSMFDMGTGSGILAIYGAMLGAARVRAVDIDPEALRWALRNIELNHCSELIELSDQPVEKVTERFSVLAANLTLNPLLELMPRFSDLVKGGGWLILSGILTEQKKRAQSSLSLNGFHQVREYQEEEWACLAGRRIA